MVRDGVSGQAWEMKSSQQENRDGPDDAGSRFPRILDEGRRASNHAGRTRGENCFRATNPTTIDDQRTSDSGSGMGRAPELASLLLLLPPLLIAAVADDELDGEVDWNEKPGVKTLNVGGLLAMDELMLKFRGIEVPAFNPLPKKLRPSSCTGLPDASFVLSKATTSCLGSNPVELAGTVIGLPKLPSDRVGGMIEPAGETAMTT